MHAARLLRLHWENRLREIREPAIWGGTLRERLDQSAIPEVLLVCTQPDQLLSVIGEVIGILERLYDQHGPEHAAGELPHVVLCSNGIYFQRVRQFYLEKLEEGTLLGRLPDLWPDLMPQLVAKLLRGVTIQTGQRQGSGPEAIYKPGPSGRTRIAGGDVHSRKRCAEVLAGLGGWFDVAEGVSPTRVEFDKALVNLLVNLLGQLAAIGEDGAFRLLTIREILGGKNEEEGRELALRVIEIGRAVHAYRPDEPFDALWDVVIASCHEYLDHIPSSLQWIGMQLETGKLQPRLTPTERWLIEPLIRYAHAAGLEEAAHYFERLTHRVEAKLLTAASHRAHHK
jgi:hypothetical protein